MPAAAPQAGALESGAVSPALAIVALALLLSIQPITTDVYLPALPALTRDLHFVLTWGEPLEAPLEETAESFLQQTRDAC